MKCTWTKFANQKTDIGRVEIKKIDPTKCHLQDSDFGVKGTTRFKGNGWKKIARAYSNQNWAAVSTLVSDKMALNQTRMPETKNILIKQDITKRFSRKKV